MEIIPFKIAKKLKEKGFPQHISDEAYIIDNYGEDEYDIGERLPIPLIPDYIDDVAAPTITQVLKWLREEKKLNIVCPFYKDRGFFYYVQRIGKAATLVSSIDDSDPCFDTAELAALAGIEYVFDNLI